jgi:C1A family cysteine protease
MNHKYGWIPDLPDQRDIKRSYTRAPALPASVDMRNSGFMPPIYDQGQLGACVWNGIAGVMQYEGNKQGIFSPMPSRLFGYYNGRAMEGTIPVDAGMSIRDGIKSANKQGVCAEYQWPYDISKFAARPWPKCYQRALWERALTYTALTPTVDEMKQCLAGGVMFVGGFSVYESFENVGPDGVVPMPGPNEAVLGGHATAFVGYIDSSAGGVIIGRNSWGTSWGASGFFLMPYAYLTDPNLADDFWAIELTS